MRIGAGQAEPAGPILSRPDPFAEPRLPAGYQGIIQCKRVICTFLDMNVDFVMATGGDQECQEL